MTSRCPFDGDGFADCSLFQPIDPPIQAPPNKDAAEASPTEEHLEEPAGKKLHSARKSLLTAAAAVAIDTSEDIEWNATHVASKKGCFPIIHEATFFFACSRLFVHTAINRRIGHRIVVCPAGSSAQ